MKNADRSCWRACSQPAQRARVHARRACTPNSRRPRRRRVTHSILWDMYIHYQFRVVGGAVRFCACECVCCGVCKWKSHPLTSIAQPKITIFVRRVQFAELSAKSRFGILGTASAPPRTPCVGMTVVVHVAHSRSS